MPPEEEVPEVINGFFRVPVWILTEVPPRYQKWNGHHHQNLIRGLRHKWLRPVRPQL